MCGALFRQVYNGKAVGRKIRKHQENNREWRYLIGLSEILLSVFIPETAEK